MKSPALKIVVAALAFAAGSALAQGYGYGPCWGEEGFGPGMGYGPGMMGGPGYGRGMGYGRGGGFGPGGGGYGPGAGANLTDEQRAKVAKLREEHRAKNWKAMGELQKEQLKLAELYDAKADAKAVAEQEKKVDALREQLFKQRNDMRREMQALIGRPS